MEGILVCSVKGHTVFKEDGIVIVNISIFKPNEASSGEGDTCLFNEESHRFAMGDGIEIWRIHLQNVSKWANYSQTWNKVSFGE